MSSSPMAIALPSPPPLLLFPSFSHPARNSMPSDSCELFVKLPPTPALESDILLPAPILLPSPIIVESHSIHPPPSPLRRTIPLPVAPYPHEVALPSPPPELPPPPYVAHPYLYYFANPHEEDALRKLRQRSQAAERAARKKEQDLASRLILLSKRTSMDSDEKRAQEDAVRMEKAAMRKRRKKERERGKEIASLLTLKIDIAKSVMERQEEKGFRLPTPPTSPTTEILSKSKGVAASVSHLVVRMIYRRRDTARPIADRRNPAFSYIPPKSPLAFIVQLDDVGEGPDDYVGPSSGEPLLIFS